MEFSDMRIPRLSVLLLFLTSGTLAAQGLEYRVRMHMNMPGMAEGLPTPEMTMLMKGEKIRVDNSTHGMSMSIIMDGVSGRFYYLNHSDKTYREEAKADHLPDDIPSDTATLRAMGMLPDIFPTSDTRTILGFAARRFVTVMRIPNPGEPGSTMLSINESWISTDPKLKEAFQSSLNIAERILGPAAKELSSLMPPGAEGVPLETNIVMLRRGATEKVDAFAILKDPNPAGLMTRVRMETLAVELRAIPDSVFAVPAGYTKSN
jgi:hypothetical protein